MIKFNRRVLTVEVLAVLCEASGFGNNVRDALTVNKYWFRTIEIKGACAGNHDHCFG
jgi:hypothetical protein